MNNQEINMSNKNAVDSEKYIIAVALTDNKTIPIIADKIKPDFFYDGFCARVWKIILKLYTSEDAVDQIMVSNVLKLNKDKEKYSDNPITALAKITTDYWVASATIDSHIKTVREYWHKRECIKAFHEHLTKANKGTDTSGDVRESFNQALSDIDRSLDLGNDLQIGVGIDETIAEWGNKRGPSTGLKMLDEITGGFIPGDYHIYGARASMGKTALMCNFIRSVALIESVPSLGFSLEMSRQRMQTRLIGAEAKVSPKRLFMNQNITPNEQMRVDKSKLRWQQAPFYLDDQSGTSIEQIRFRTRKHVQEHGVKVIFVDYLQLVSIERKNIQNREQEVARIAEGLKGIGKDMNVCVIAFSQLSRETDRRIGNRPRLTDLRESGAIEQAADIIGLVHRPEYYGTTFDEEHGDMRGKAYIYIDKQRNGETGEVECDWDDKIAQFS